MTRADLLLVQDPRFGAHHASGPHPERPERLVSVGRAIDAAARECTVPFTPLAPRAATSEEVLRVHSGSLLAEIEAAAARAPSHLDPDTYVCATSYETALLAAGSTVDLALRIADGHARCGLAAVRPPGHHAEATHAMGFCLLNNVAIAARALQARAGLEKILVFDWDVHHGNGTQHTFEDDPSVLYVSTHQFPHYPGTGAVGETGRGPGAGATVNIPMPPGCGDVEYIGASMRILVPVARHFDPDMILISCGFDAHADDPLASMELTGEGFFAMSRIVRALADELCDGRILFALEGGYAPSGLYDGTLATLRGLLEPTPMLPEMPEAAPGSTLRAIVDPVVQAHAAHTPGLGSI